MHSHIAIEGQLGSLTLKPNTDLTITDKNPMLNDVEMFSQPIQLSFDLNRHLLKNMDNVNSSIKAEDVEGSKYRIIVDGIPLRNAVIKVQDGVNLDGDIDVNFDATHRTFKEMIANMRCRDVAVDDNILIGEKIGDVEVNMTYQEILDLWIMCNKGTIKGYEVRIKPVVIADKFQPFALGFSYPAECYENASTHKADLEPDATKAKKTYPNPNGGGNITVNVPHVKTSYINVNQPYPTAKYCNSRIAYAHHKVKTEDGRPTGETSDEIVPASERNTSIPEDKSPYWVLDADRPTSGICFYVAYFLERLFKQLGVAYDMSALTDISDFNYMAFFTTQCHFDARPKEGAVLSGEQAINDWLVSRGCGGKINFADNCPTEGESLAGKGIRQVDVGADEWESWQIVGDHG